MNKNEQKMVMLSAGRGGRSGGGGGLASLDDLVSHFYIRQLPDMS